MAVLPLRLGLREPWGEQMAAPGASIAKIAVTIIQTEQITQAGGMFQMMTVHFALHVAKVTLVKRQNKLAVVAIEQKGAKQPGG